MIPVQEAIRLVKENVTTTTKTKKISLNEALNYVLAQDVFSPISMPPFRQSAMDGYALFLHNKKSYKIIGEIQAGDSKQPVLKQGEAVRIFTGAAVPETANAVIMQEQTSTSQNNLLVRENPKEETNIRPLGEQIIKGNLALPKKTKLNPAAIGFLSSLGINKVTVNKKPSVAIITTGNELVAPGVALSYGKIYESNGIMLVSALQKSGFTNVTTYNVADDYTQTYNLLKKVSDVFDVVLFSGGISVGDYDFVGKAMQELNVKKIFYKVKQKPGKPLYFGVKNKVLYFGLPGNPASTLSCFYSYVFPALELLQGNTNCHLPVTVAEVTNNFIKKGTRAQFLKANYKNGKVTILEGQASSMLHTFALANALVFVPEEKFQVFKSEMVKVIYLPI